MNLSVKDFLLYTWQFPYEHLYTDHDCSVTRTQGQRGDLYMLVYRNPQASTGFTMVPFYYVNSDQMDQIVNDAQGKLTSNCTNFLYGMLG